MGIPRREDGDFIEGIYNWCDRWCERCPMTTRCRQYAMECTRDAFNADGSNDGDSAEFMEALMCVAGEFENQAEIDANPEFDSGFEDSEPETENCDSYFEEFDMEAYMAERDQIEKATSETACVKAADKYMSEGGRWLDEWDILFDEMDDGNESIDDAMEVISWYLFQLSVKLRRAVSGKIEADFDYMDDVYGSAKVVLIGADRSLDAWRTIRGSLPEENRDSVDPVIKCLIGLIKSTEEEIPEARPFKRPGFDD